jgi:hypothetical protein
VLTATDVAVLLKKMEFGDPSAAALAAATPGGSDLEAIWKVRRGSSEAAPRHHCRPSGTMRPPRAARVNICSVGVWG